MFYLIFAQSMGGSRWCCVSGSKKFQCVPQLYNTNKYVFLNLIVLLFSTIILDLRLLPSAGTNVGVKSVITNLLYV